jgi:tripartite-type tricarboxylate transporter receptor subunit TctC
MRRDKIVALWQHHIARPCQINPAARIMSRGFATAGERCRSGGRNMMLKAFKRGLLAAAFLVVAASGGRAQSVADFYKGKNIDLYVGYSAGGGYDLYARQLARYMGRHIPGNPTLVPKNMTGAGSLVLTNWLYNIGAKDGTVFGIIGRGTAFDPLLGNTKAKFDATKFTWIGSANNEVSICVAWHTSGITKFDDLLTKELVVGGTSSSADTDQFPKIINGVLGTKIKIITGYPGGNDVGLAMERGEVQGRCGWSWSSVKSTHQQWYDQKKFTVLMQLALEKHPDLPDIPLITDLAKTDEQRQILKLIFARQVMGRPFLAPPSVPKDRADALRKAFMDTMNDPDFRAEADKAKMEITPVSGEALDKLVKEIYATPAAIAKKAGDLIERK